MFLFSMRGEQKLSVGLVSTLASMFNRDVMAKIITSNQFSELQLHGAVDYALRGQRDDTISWPLTTCQSVRNFALRRERAPTRNINAPLKQIYFHCRRYSQLLARSPPHDIDTSVTELFRCYEAIKTYRYCLFNSRSSRSDHHSVHTHTLLLLLFATIYWLLEMRTMVKVVWNDPINVCTCTWYRISLLDIRNND